MASRFVDAASVDEFISEQEYKSTAQKTQRDVKLLQLFLVTKKKKETSKIYQQENKMSTFLAL